MIELQIRLTWYIGIGRPLYWGKKRDRSMTGGQKISMKGEVMSRLLRWFLAGIAVVFLVTGCGGGSDETGMEGGDTLSANTIPVSNAGADQNVLIGEMVTLDGSASFDADGDALHYTWTLTTPLGSEATLSDPSVANPTFIPDVVGVYEAQLVVDDGSDSSSADTVLVNAAYSPIYPKVMDSYEGTTGDNNLSTASTIAVGEDLQGRSIFPQGDYDWVKVELEEGVVYDIFAMNLNETGDTYLYIYDIDGVELAQNDDYIDYDSYIEFNATYTGTFYLKVRSYWVGELSSYQLGVRVHADVDNDNYSAVYDCNDNNDTIYPFAREIAGDGIDQDCSGVDAIAQGTPDLYETDDDFDTAQQIPELAGSYMEIEHRDDIASQMRTIHDTTDTDFYAVTLPPYSAAYIIEASTYWGGNALSGYDWYIYNADQSENSSGGGYLYEKIENNTTADKTYYFEVRSNGTDIGWYVPAVVHIGEDKDGDGFYTMDWANDCNDANASINPYADDSNDTDGIDMNCDGIDGENSNYDS